MRDIREKKYLRLYAVIFVICLVIMLFLLHFTIKTTVGDKITEEKRSESNIGSANDTALTQEELQDSDKVQDYFEGMTNSSDLYDMFITTEEQSDNATEGK